MLTAVLVLLLILAPGPVWSACLADALTGGPLPSWDQRDALARKLEAEGDPLGLGDERIRRLAFALRMGQHALDQLDPAERAVLGQVEAGCDPPEPEQPVPSPGSFGFDLQVGWPHLAASIGVMAICLGVLRSLARWNALSRRRNKRYFCSINITCQDSDGAVFQCRVRDVSPSGLRMTAPKTADLAIGDALTLDFRTFRISGHIVSRNRHYSGVAFSRDLTRAELLHLVRPEKYPTPFGGTDAHRPAA